MSEHAKLSPSNARWPNCPGSVRVEAPYPDVAGAAAIDGTGTHLLLELVLKNNVPPENYDMQLIGVNHPDNPMGWHVSIERIERVRVCLDYLERRRLELYDRYPESAITIVSENRVDPGGMFGRTDWWGTCDIAIYVVKDNKCLFIEVVDYKDGRGFVSAEDNNQLLSYLAGNMRAWIASGESQVAPLTPGGVVDGGRMTIVQPRSTTPIRYEDVTTETVISRATRLAEAAAETDKEDAPLVTGKHCQWCKHKDNCTAGGSQSLVTMTQIAGGTEGNMVDLLHRALGNITSMSEEDLANILDMKDGLDALFAKVSTEIEERISRGDVVPGYIMAGGRKNQKWSKNEEEMIKVFKARRLKQDVYAPRSIISPAQMMKLTELTEDQKKKIIKDNVVITTTKQNLVKVERKTVNKADVFLDTPEVKAKSFL